MAMAKKKTEKATGIDLNDAQKRMDQYVKACDREKKGKATALSMIGITVLCLLILLIVSLKMNGIGFVNTVNVNTGATTVAGADEVQKTKLADIVTQ